MKHNMKKTNKQTNTGLSCHDSELSVFIVETACYYSNNL